MVVLCNLFLWGGLEKGVRVGCSWYYVKVCLAFWELAAHTTLVDHASVRPPKVSSGCQGWPMTTSFPARLPVASGHQHWAVDRQRSPPGISAARGAGGDATSSVGTSVTWLVWVTQHVGARGCRTLTSVPSPFPPFPPFPSAPLPLLIPFLTPHPSSSPTLFSERHASRLKRCLLQKSEEDYVCAICLGRQCMI